MPTPGVDLELQRADLMRSIGTCLMAWADAEFRIGIMFDASCGVKAEIAARIWGRIRSFEAKLLVLKDVLASRWANEPSTQRDWTLLHAHILALYGQRNRVAHATVVINTSDTPTNDRITIKPFLSLGDPNFLEGHLGNKELASYTHGFNALTDSLTWFLLNHAVDPSRRPQSPAPAPDLILQLRTEDDRKREEQRLRALALRQYLERNPPAKG